jgi:hypothetical protein
VTATNDHVRIAKTEALYREVNERIAETAERFGGEEADFMCECAEPECMDRVTAPLAEYEDVRSDGATFLLSDGHEKPHVETVLARRGGYAIVQKVHTTVARIVRQLNPRAA